MKQVWGCLGVCGGAMSTFSNISRILKHWTKAPRLWPIDIFPTLLPRGGMYFLSQTTPVSCTSVFLSVPVVASRQEGRTVYNMCLQYVLAGTCYLCSSDLPNTSSLYRETYYRVQYLLFCTYHFLSHFLVSETVVLHHSYYCICYTHATGRYC